MCGCGEEVGVAERAVKMGTRKWTWMVLDVLM